jgi:hypothetical protein
VARCFEDDGAILRWQPFDPQSKCLRWHVRSGALPGRSDPNKPGPRWLLTDPSTSLEERRCTAGLSRTRPCRNRSYQVSHRSTVRLTSAGEWKERAGFSSERTTDGRIHTDKVGLVVLGVDAHADAEAAARALQANIATGEPKSADGPAEVVRALHVARRSALNARTAPQPYRKNSRRSYAGYPTRTGSRARGSSPFCAAWLRSGGLLGQDGAPPPQQSTLSGEAMQCLVYTLDTDFG